MGSRLIRLAALVGGLAVAPCALASPPAAPHDTFGIRLVGVAGTRATSASRARTSSSTWHQARMSFGWSRSPTTPRPSGKSRSIPPPPHCDKEGSSSVQVTAGTSFRAGPPSAQPCCACRRGQASRHRQDSRSEHDLRRRALRRRLGPAVGARGRPRRRHAGQPRWHPHVRHGRRRWPAGCAASRSALQSRNEARAEHPLLSHRFTTRADPHSRSKAASTSTGDPEASARGLSQSR